MLVTILWLLIAGLFIVLGILAFFAAKPVGFWANAPVERMQDVRGYNAAMGRLFIAAGVAFAVIGLPLMLAPDAPLALVASVLGAALWAIALMAVYELAVAKRYRAKG